MSFAPPRSPRRRRSREIDDRRGAEQSPAFFSLVLPHLIQRAFASIGSAVSWCFGVASLLVCLALLASVPVGQFIVLGYLLEASGRVTRSGRLRDGFIGVRTAARIGAMAAMLGLMWLPLYFLSLEAQAAQIINPDGPIARQWQIWLAVMATLFALHAAAALLRGGRIRDFVRPLNLFWLVRQTLFGGLWSKARDRAWNAIAEMRIPYCFWLGVRGFVGAFLWLAIPVLLLAQGHRIPLLGVIGGLLLAAVVLYLPFLQVRFARDNRLRAFRELRRIRIVYRHAPLEFALALWAHLLFAVPLYLLKIELIPRDLVFLEGFLFLLFIFPARLLTGWAYSRGVRREMPQFWLWRWLGRLAAVPVVIAYVFVVFLSEHIGWQGGAASLVEQHAFLLPVPFVIWK